MSNQTTEALARLIDAAESYLAFSCSEVALEQEIKKARAALSSQPPAPTHQELRAKFEASINKNEWCTTYDLAWDESINSYDSAMTHDAWCGFLAASLTATAGSTP